MDVDEFGNTIPLQPSDGTVLGGRGDLPAPGGLTDSFDNTHYDCPDNCCEVENENCYRTRDVTGYEIEPDEEIMLVFGGMTVRNKTDADGNLLFDTCETDGETMESRTPGLRTCGQEFLNELWRYHIKRDVWTPIKPDYNRLEYSSFIQPVARYEHSAAYVEVTSQDSSTNNQILIRKFMYIYGGFSFECTTACYDLWRYEIPYGPQRFYPQPYSSSQWWNRGNHWTLMKKELVNTPGPRWRHKMVTDYNMENLFLFGGIVTNDG